MNRALKFGCMAVAMAAWAAGCGREAPPEIQEYVPLHVAKAAPATQKAGPEAVAETTAPTPEAPTPVVEAPKPPPAMEIVAEVKAPVAAAPTEAKAPSIVGTWKVVEMSQHGQAQPLPPGMTMQLTFGEDGTFGISMAGMPEGAGGEMPKGTYTVNGEHISITAQGESKSGKLSFDGNDKATIDVDEMKMTLARS